MNRWGIRCFASVLSMKLVITLKQCPFLKKDVNGNVGQEGVMKIIGIYTDL